jgi:2-desacetyl-2-hydroxyethyl bacteriochlorophyllide A dehydrogenase
MKAMVLGAPSAVSLEDVETPNTDAGDSIVRVTHSGICGTDLKIFTGGIPARYPLIMGHEMIGEVVEAAVSETPKAGTRVIVDPVTFCGDCFHCAIGQTQLCPNGGLIGRDRDGGFAEYVVAPPGKVYELPDDIGGEAPLLQVLTTCLHGHRLARIFAGESVVVNGLGVTGQLHVQLAKAFGAHPVIGITRSAWKRELAETLGADLTLAPGDDMIARVRDATEGRGPDVVIETVGKVASLGDAIRMARTGGRLLLFGIYTETEGALPFYDLYFKELQLIDTRAAQPRDYPASIDLARRGTVKLAPLISHTLALDELDTALAMLDSGAGRQMKILLDHG